MDRHLTRRDLLRIGAMGVSAAALGGCSLFGNDDKAKQDQDGTSGGKLRLIGMHDSAKPGSEDAVGALAWARDNGVDVIMNYTGLGAKDVTKDYLDQAQAAGRKIILNLTDFYPEENISSSRRAIYDQYGKTPDERAVNVAQTFSQHPALWGFAISSNQPQSAASLADWPARLANRRKILAAVTNKPLTGTLRGWTTDNAEQRIAYAKAVKAACDHLLLSYYPIPEGNYGPVNRIKTIAEEANTAAGANSWFVLQTFSWAQEDDRYERAVRRLFPSNAPAPTAEQMVTMAKLALDNGANHLMLQGYYLLRDDPDQLDAVSAALKQIRPLMGR